MMRLTMMILVFMAFMPTEGRAETWGLRSDLDCAARDAVIDRLAEATRVDLRAEAVAIGERFTLGWARPGFPEREPIFLMVSFDGPVRLKGDGLYLLLPGAKAAFGISWEAERTRAVIPYYGRGMPTSGEIEVEPLRSGTLQVRWAVVGHNGCDEYLDTPLQGAIAVTVRTAGRPEIVVRDPATDAAPDDILANRDGTRHLQLYDSHFRLIDAATGAQVFEGVGTAPHFSPAGRFVVVQGGDEAGVYDSVDGRRVTPDYGGWNALVWSHQDSFALQLSGGYDASTLHGFALGNRMEVTGGGCRVCGSVGNFYRLDLENNVVFAEGNNAINVRRLTDGASISGLRLPYDESLTDADRQTVHAETERTQAVAEVTLATSPVWSDSTAVGAPFMEFGHKVLEIGVSDWIPDALKDLVAEPRRVTPEAMAAAGQVGPAQPAEVTWRSLGAGETAEMTSRVLKRLREFGLPLVAGTAMEKTSAKDLLAAAGTLDTSLTGDAFKRAYQEQKDLEQAFFSRYWQQIAATTGVQGFAIPEFGCGVPNGYVGEFDTIWRWSDAGHTYWLTTVTCADGSAAFLYPETYLMSRAYPGGMATHVPSWGGLESGLDLDDPEVNTATICTYGLDACGFEAQVFGSTLILYSRDALGYAIVDLGTGQVIAKQFNLPRGDLFDDVLLTEDGRHLVTLQDDGTFFVNRIADAATVLSGLYADDEVIVWTEDGRYDATSEGAYFVSYTFPGHLGEYTAQQFEGYLKVPGLVRAVLSGSYRPENIVITPPPVLRAGIEVMDGQVRIDAEARAQVPLKALALFEDGLRSHSFPATGLAATWEEEVTLLPGTRWLSLVATDANGVASAPYSVEIAPVEPRQLHILSIGVDDYGDPALDLEAAAADARLFAATLSGRAGEGIEIRTETVLIDGAATPERILQSLEATISTVAAGDTLALYFAGHGLEHDGRFYLGASGLDADDIAGTALPFDALSARLRAEDLRIALFLDACHSGLAGEGLYSTNDDMVGGALDQIPSGIVVFAAAKGREYSVEDPVSGHGYFTQALSEVLSTPGYDANGNGTVEISELFGATKSMVSERVREALDGVPGAEAVTQTPWMARNLMVGDFALF